MPISFTLNERAIQVAADPDTPLLDVLRNHLGLVGAKFGCGLEQCGCCMVLIDGRPEKSCGKALSTAAGKQIATIEGIGTRDKPHPPESKWCEWGGRARRKSRTRCRRPFSTSRPDNAAIACRGSSSPRKRCST